MTRHPLRRKLRKRIRPRSCSDKSNPQSKDDDVGYGKPPREHRFKPGQSGNPKGRPKGAKSEATILNELLRRKIAVREDGRSRKITVLEAILLRFTEDSLKGNTKSAQFLLNRHNALTTNEPQRPELSEDDNEILAAFAERILVQKSVK
jgi:hypothetical protein